MSEETGYIDFHYKGEAFQTWYRVVGDLKTGDRPLVILHGGPAIANPYLNPHTELYSNRNIPVIFYDQIGCGKSTHLHNKPAEFISLDLFKDELDNVLMRLGVVDNFDLYGHSCGGMLAVDYVVSRQPKGLNRLILGNTTASTPLFVSCIEKLLDQMSPGLAEKMKRHEAEGTMEDEEYQDTAKLFMKKYICSMEPMPKEVEDALEVFGQDKTVFDALWGPYEFKITGSLELWSVIDKLHTITVPTLVINGVTDEMQDECNLPFFEKIAKVKWVQFKSGHMPFYEEKERYFQVIGGFLRP